MYYGVCVRSIVYYPMDPSRRPLTRALAYARFDFPFTSPLRRANVPVLCYGAHPVKLADLRGRHRPQCDSAAIGTAAAAPIRPVTTTGGRLRGMSGIRASSGRLDERSSHRGGLDRLSPYWDCRVRWKRRASRMFVRAQLHVVINSRSESMRGLVGKKEIQ